MTLPTVNNRRIWKLALYKTTFLLTTLSYTEVCIVATQLPHNDYELESRVSTLKR